MSVPSLPPLPPRSATEIVDGAVQLVRPEFGYFIRITAIGAIPALLQAVITLIVFPQTSALDPDAMMRRELSMLPLTLLTTAFATMQSGAVIAGGLAQLRGDPLPGVWEAFMLSFRRIFALLGANLLLVVALVVVLFPIAIGLGVLIAMNPGVFKNFVTGGGNTAKVIGVLVAIVMLFVLALVVLTVIARSAIMTVLVIAEKLGPWQALKRAHQLSEGNYLRLTGTYALVAVIIVVVYLVMGAVALALYSQQALLQAIMSVLLIPVAPIIGGIMLLTYADLRVRREGADLDAALDSMTGYPIAG